MRAGAMRESADYLTVRLANPWTGMVSPSAPGTPDEQGEGGPREVGNAEVEELSKTTAVESLAKELQQTLPDA